MKDYHIRFELAAQSKKENIARIIKAGQRLGFTFEGQTDDRSLSINEAIEAALEEELINFIIDDAAFVLYLPSMSFIASGYALKWKKQFRSTYLPDNIKVLELLLAITNDFIIERLYIHSYLQLLDVPARKNVIMANSLVRIRQPDEELSDGKVLFLSAFKHDYKFICDPNKERNTINLSIPALEASETLDAIEAGKTYEFYLMVDNYVVLLEITPEAVSIIAQEPIKLKIVDGQQDYDRAFYIRILLNLLEYIGIDEIVCTL